MVVHREYKKEHSAELESYTELKEKYDGFAGEDKTLGPKAWQNEIAELEKSLKDYNKSAVGKSISLATAEVILYNKKDLERQMENEERQQNKQQQKAKHINQGID